jgi:hypothetical protein
MNAVGHICARADQGASHEDALAREVLYLPGLWAGLDPDSETLWIRIRIQGQENEEISVEKCTF